MHIQRFSESTRAFQCRLHHLKWQLQNGSHVKQHPQKRKKSVAKTKLFHKVRRKIAQVKVQKGRFKTAELKWQIHNGRSKMAYTKF